MEQGIFFLLSIVHFFLFMFTLIILSIIDFTGNTDD